MTLLALLLTLVGYELLRYAALRALRLRWQRSIGDFLQRHQVQLDHFRFIDRVWVRQTLLQDAELDRAAAESATRSGDTIGVVRARIEVWLDEIVPYFNLFSYYKIGAAAARAAVAFVYEAVVDEGALARSRAAVPAGAVTVYVANHRSNADYVVLSVGALRHVALSYAVGEWARVWPLDVLFRSFGSYFVRRGEKDPLYHRVLARYLQLVAGRGLTTAFFLEGGLSRDGALRQPKIGLLDYLVGVLRDDPTRQIAFIPVGINFDRVLEDRNLTAEVGNTPPPSIADKARSALKLVLRAPRLFFAVFTPRLRRIHLKYGYAAVGFGPPVVLGTVMPDAVAVAHLPDPARRPRVAALADLLMAEVAKVIPATPVPMVCRALLDGVRDVPGIKKHVREQLTTMREEGRPIALGRAFKSVEIARRHTPDDGVKGSLDVDIVDAEEAERVVDLALSLLARRRLIRVAAGRVEGGDDVIFRYYALSLAPPTNLAAAGPQRSIT